MVPASVSCAAVPVAGVACKLDIDWDEDDDMRKCERFMAIWSNNDKLQKTELK